MTGRRSGADAVLCGLALLASLALAVGRIRPLELAADAGAEAPLRPIEWKVDLNRADAGQLQLLPGVGPGLARRIEADRRLHGPFRDPSDLIRVSGVGPALIGRIRPFVR
jgi:DNA uptake protein ComE-like DNA-binding protein